MNPLAVKMFKEYGVEIKLAPPPVMAKEDQAAAANTREELLNLISNDSDLHKLLEGMNRTQAEDFVYTILGKNGTNSSNGGEKGIFNKNFPPDIYLTLVIATVSLIVLGVIFYACYKGIRLLKLSFDETPSVTVQTNTVNAAGTGSNGDNSNSDVNAITSQSGAVSTTERNDNSLSRFAEGIRMVQQNFASTFRNASAPRPGDDPPPYDSMTLPPSYREAMKNEKSGKKSNPENPTSCSSTTSPEEIRSISSSCDEPDGGGSSLKCKIQNLHLPV